MHRFLMALLILSVPAAAAAQTETDLFDDGALQEVRLVISGRDWQALKANSDENTYYPADLTWRGITVRNLGIRSRGSGTRNGVKPGLRVDVNHYLSNQDFLGLMSDEARSEWKDYLWRQRLKAATPTRSGTDAVA